MKQPVKSRTTSILLMNPTLTEVANCYRKWLVAERPEELELIYTGAIRDSLTDGKLYEFQGSLIVEDILPFDNLILLYLHETNGVGWYVEPVEPYTIEILTPDAESANPIVTLTEINLPNHIIQAIKDSVVNPPADYDETPESRTRRELIDPALEECGWSDELLKRELFFKSDVDETRNYVNYALYAKETKGQKYILTAFLEAKHERLPPDYGLEQAKLYADRAQANIRLVFASNGSEYVSFDRLTQQKSVAMSMAQFPRPDELANLLSQGRKYIDPPFVSDRLPVPKSHLDPTSEDDARAVIERLYPDAGLCRLCLRFFAESIRHANQFGAGKWEVTLGENGHCIRLNVGKIEVCALFCNQINLILDEDTFEEQDRYRAERLSLITEATVYRNVPSSMACDFIASTLTEIKPFVLFSYQSLIAKSADTVKKRTGYYIYHSSGVMDYLQHKINSMLPNPIF